MSDDSPAAPITQTTVPQVAGATSLTDPLDRNPAAIYLASLHGESRRTMRTALNTLAGLLHVGEILNAEGRDVRCLHTPWAQLRYQHTAALRAALQERYAPATANKLLAALRRVLKEARRLGQLSADDYDGAVDVRNVRGERLPRGRLISDAEVIALMRTCAEDLAPAGARDAAMVALLRGSGLRRAEVVALDLSDYDSATGAITIHEGKGRKDRLVYAPHGACAALNAWIAVRGSAPGPLFYGLVKGGTLVPRRLAPQAVAVVCAARGRTAGLSTFTPHDMRRTFISGLLDAGADIATVQQLAGHEDPATTSRYDRRGEVAKQRATALIHIPFFARATTDQ
jgi:integrase